MKTNILSALVTFAITASMNVAQAAPRAYDLTILHCENVRSIPETYPNPEGVPTEYVAIHSIQILESETTEGGDEGAVAIVQTTAVEPTDSQNDVSVPEILVIPGTFTYEGEGTFTGESAVYRLNVTYRGKNSSVRLEEKEEGEDFVDFINTTSASCNRIQYESIGVHN